MRVEITPEPDEQERRAILAALAAGAAAEADGSAWTRAALPGRGEEEDDEA